MTPETETSLLSDIKEIKRAIKSSGAKNPNETLTIQQACLEYPIGHTKLIRLCRARGIIHYRGDGETSTIYLKRKDLEDYFFSDDKVQLVNNH